MSIFGPNTDIEIQSNAAVLLGKKSFTTIDDADEFAVSLQAMYNMLVDSELSSNQWKFAKTQIELSRIAGFDPEFDQWTSAYALPQDFLSLSRIFPRVDWEIFEERLYTNTTQNLKMEYNHRVPVTRWSPMFKKYMVYQLAVTVAAAVTENLNMMQALSVEMERARIQAMWIDAQNAPNVPIQDNPYIDARFTSSYRFDQWGRR